MGKVDAKGAGRTEPSSVWGEWYVQEDDAAQAMLSGRNYIEWPLTGSELHKHFGAGSEKGKGKRAYSTLRLMHEKILDF